VPIGGIEVPGILDQVATISGRLVTLRPISREDYSTLFKWRSNFDEVHALNFRRRFSHWEEFTAEMDSWLPSVTLFLVSARRDGHPIGFVLAHSVNPWDGWMTVAIYIEESYRPTGYGGDAALLCLDALFRTYPIRKIMTEIYEFAGSQLNLARAIGFEEAGFMPEHYWKDDRHWGLHYMVLTRDAWLTTRERLEDMIAVQQQFDHLVRANGS
jgi:RimJ/RimL family protein N-acetyltransferase